MAAGPDGEVIIDPMSQFAIKPLFGGELGTFTITNSTLWMGLTVLAVVLLLLLGTRGRNVVPTRMQSVAEVLYGFIRQMCVDVLGEEGVKFFPYIFTLFMFILFSNLLGMWPYKSFTTTSHVAVTGVLALGVFLTVVILGVAKNGLSFFGMFWVTSAPLALRPALAIIEIISFFVRPLSHSIRLAGNMMAGHAVLKVFAGLAAMIVAGGLLPLAILPIGAMVALTALELLVAVVQAYIFAILTCIYLNDAVNPHH